MTLLLVLIACSGEPTEPVPEPAPVAPAPAPGPSEVDREAALGAAAEAAKKLGSTLKTRLAEEMGTNGPAAAATVCADEARTLTAAVAAETGAVVGRSSLRLRNPENAPPPWVKEWLEAQGERPAEGVTGIDRVDEEGGAWVARVLRPIPAEAPCLSCHGPADALAEGVPALLAARYPEDRATGYALGDLRGALYAELVVTSGE